MTSRRKIIKGVYLSAKRRPLPSNPKMSQTEKAPEYETWADDAGVCEKLCCPRSNACARDAIITQNCGGVASPKSNTVPTPPNPPLQVGQNARNSKLKIQGGTIFDSFQFMLVDPDIVEESMTMQVFLTDPSSGDMGRAWGESNVCHSQSVPVELCAH